MNVIDYIMITWNKKKYVRLQITSDYMIKLNQLQLITITNYDDPMSANQHQELPVGPVNYCFKQFTVSTLVYVLTYVCAFSTNFPLPTFFYLRSPLFYIISWIIYYPKSRIIFLNFISFQWFCQFYFIFILFSLKWPCYL
jgi:hypothetical protein